MRPFPDYAAAAAGADRSRAARSRARRRSAEFPALERDTLSNGLKIVLAERRSIPQVRFDLLLDAGFAADQFAQPGTASLAMSMLDEGTATRTRARRSATAWPSSAPRSAPASRLDVSSVSLEALRERLDPALALYADVILHPAVPPGRLRAAPEAAAGRRSSARRPTRSAWRCGSSPGSSTATGTPTRNPWTGSGTEASTAKITRDDLVEFHRTWFKPNHATLVVVGATTMAEIRPKLERLFAALAAGRRADEEHRRRRAAARSPTVYLLDRPGASRP